MEEQAEKVRVVLTFDVLLASQPFDVNHVPRPGTLFDFRRF